MKVLITGGNGYIAKSLYNAFKDKYKVVDLNLILGRTQIIILECIIIY